MLADEQRAVRNVAGLPQVHPDREVLNGVPWVLRTGSKRDLYLFK